MNGLKCLCGLAKAVNRQPQVRYFSRLISVSSHKRAAPLSIQQGVPPTITCGFHTSSSLTHLLDARDKNAEKKQMELIIKEKTKFDEAAKKKKDKEAYQQAVSKYNLRPDKYKRGHVEFIYASMDKMVEFGAHKDINTYRMLLDIFPKNKMKTTTTWQAEMMHYPKQQQCCIDILDAMESHGVCPDDKMGSQLIEIFGKKAIVFRKYQRMMYWIPKFKNINPYPIPWELPEDPTELAVLALKRMAVDQQNIVSVFQASDLETSLDKTFIASAQCVTQEVLLNDLPRDKPIFVEGGFSTWLREKCLYYFILRAEVTTAFTKYQQNLDKSNQDDKDTSVWSNLFESEQPRAVVVKPSLHEQEDGTILAMCITGTGTKDSLVSWINFLQDANPALKEIPIVFTLKSPDIGLEVVEETSNNQEVAVPA